jgi:hypothetical protein
MQAQAASISGTVTSEVTGRPLSSGVYVDLYAYDAEFDWWNWYDYQYIGPGSASGAFSFSDVPAGTYYVKTNAYDGCHLDEYYDDATSVEDKTELAINDSPITLNPIELTTYPLCVTHLEVYPYYVPATGGRITLSGTAYNLSGAPYPLEYWVSMYTWNDDWPRGYGEVTVVGPHGATLPTGGKPFSLSIDVPPWAPNDRSFEFELKLGNNSWDPILSEWAGSIYKYGPDIATDDVDGVDRSYASDRSVQRIPERVAADGTVLLWREVQERSLSPSTTGR